MERIASFLRLVQFNSFDFFSCVLLQKKVKAAKLQYENANKINMSLNEECFSSWKKKSKREAKKSLNKINISSFKSRLRFRKNLREKSKLELLQMKLKEENVGCMYVCMFYPN